MVTSINIEYDSKGPNGLAEVSNCENFIKGYPTALILEIICSMEINYIHY